MRSVRNRNLPLVNGEYGVQVTREGPRCQSATCLDAPGRVPSGPETHTALGKAPALKMARECREAPTGGTRRTTPLQPEPAGATECQAPDSDESLDSL
jgi:hypothetical protein